MELGHPTPHITVGSGSLASPPPGAVLTIGNFDGVHRGHRHIVERLRLRASDLGGTACLLTFDPPPSRVVGRREPVPQITTLADRQWLLAEAGLDKMVVEPFTEALASWPPERFVEEILYACFRPVELWVGYDFAFGRDRKGDVSFLERWFRDKGCQVRQLTAVTDPDGEIISSTRVRARVLDGDVEGAAALLTRPHFVRGLVVQGDQRGRTIGFPTANIQLATELLPCNGVYATWLSVGGKAWPGVTNIGTRPTFQGSSVRVETHVFDFSADLYGKPVTVWFEQRIRDEMHFAGLDALVAQIQRDSEQARALLAGRGGAIPLVGRSTAS